MLIEDGLSGMAIAFPHDLALIVNQDGTLSETRRMSPSLIASPASLRRAGMNTHLTRQPQYSTIQLGIEKLYPNAVSVVSSSFVSHCTRGHGACVVLQRVTSQFLPGGSNHFQSVLSISPTSSTRLLLLEFSTVKCNHEF
jgi:hypothetical protein